MIPFVLFVFSNNKHLCFRGFVFEKELKDSKRKEKNYHFLCFSQLEIKERKGRKEEREMYH